MQTVTDPLGHTTVHDFDSQRRRVKLVDALGHETRYEYDGNGNLTRTTFHDGSTRTASYDPAGRRITETDQAGRTTTFGYDAVGRLVSVTNAEGETTTYTRDEVGNLVEQTDAEGRKTRFEYDAAGRLTRRVKPLGQEETFAYDPEGDLIAHTDANGVTVGFEYDVNNRLVRKELPEGPVLYAYQPTGLRTRAGDDTFLFDARGRLVRETKAGGAVVEHGWDAAGNRTSVKAGGVTTTYAYDALNRLTTITDPTGVTTYGYDAVGNRTGLTRPNGAVTTWEYDDLNRLEAVVNAGPGGALRSRYDYTLGPAGNRITVAESGPATTGRTVTYAYDGVYRLTGETVDEPGTADDRAVAYEYDDVANRLTKTTVAGGATVVVASVYDDNDRLTTEAATTTMARRAFPPRLLAGFTLSPVVGVLWAWGLGWRRGGGSRRVRRRRLRRRLVVLPMAVTLVLAPAVARAAMLDLVTPRAAAAATTMETTTYTYDDEGNTLSRTQGAATDTYQWDAEDRLVGAALAVGTTVAFGYDADGIRNRRTVDGVATRIVTDRSVELARVLVEDDGTEPVRYVWGDDLLAQSHATAGVHFPLTDGQASVRHLTDTAGNVTDAYTYDAFGVTLSQTGSTPNDFRFVGEQRDPNVGFQYHRARWYAQATGRFLSTDPAPGQLFDPLTLHKYLYAGADPVNKADPSGLDFTLLGISFSFAQWAGLSALAGVGAGLLTYAVTKSKVAAFAIGGAVFLGLLTFGISLEASAIAAPIGSQVGPAFQTFLSRLLDNIRIVMVGAQQLSRTLTFGFRRFLETNYNSIEAYNYLANRLGQLYQRSGAICRVLHRCVTLLAEGTVAAGLAAQVEIHQVYNRVDLARFRSEVLIPLRNSVICP
jgi:RHS repeat-associated protein